MTTEVPGKGWPDIRLSPSDEGKIFCVSMVPGSGGDEVSAIVPPDQIENFIRSNGAKIDFRVITTTDITL